MKAFLSSTYVDLIEHRQLAAEALERLGQAVGRMEVFGARPEEATQACLSEIEDCDIFVGIYAYRYGHVPSGSEISITEAEYNHASNNQKPIFCFMVDEDYPWPPKMIEQQPGKSKLENFKNRAGGTLVLETFTSPEVLAFKIASSVGYYLSRINRSPLVTTPKDFAPTNLKSIAGRAISQTMAMVFVDLMRLLYVASSRLARDANSDRYQEFIDLADRHFGDLRSRIATYSFALDGKCHEEINQLELRLSWMMGRVKLKRDLSNSYEYHFETMRQTGNKLNSFCTANLTEQYKNDYENTVAKATSILAEPPVNLESLDDLWQLRLNSQRRLLKDARESGGARIFTIADDMEQTYSILYFAIDYLLLTMRAGENDA
ncbi:MAG TPA: DUF4062 domain-containing protein [Pyrinomonadaceae bacterium]